MSLVYNKLVQCLSRKICKIHTSGIVLYKRKGEQRKKVPFVNKNKDYMKETTFKKIFVVLHQTSLIRLLKAFCKFLTGFLNFFQVFKNQFFDTYFV